MTTDDGSFEAAALNHLRDALRASSSERWQWLKQAMALGFATARTRAAKGLVTLGPQGEVLWSPRHEALWTEKGELPAATGLAALGGRS